MFHATNPFAFSACALALLTAVGCTDDPTPDDDNDNDDTADDDSGTSDDSGTAYEDDSGTTPKDDSGDDSGTTPEDDSGEIPDPFVPLSLDGKHYGTTYSELNVAWFQWILSQPRVGNPGYDPNGADCAAGQSGDVWFLAGSFNQSIVERSCTIPSGKAIFFPILNAYTTCYFYPGTSCTEKFLVSELEATLDGATDMFATIDGEDVGDPADYRVHATEFSVTLPKTGNVWQSFGVNVSGPVEDLYGAGYWMLFDPLPAGKHTITFGGLVPGAWANDNTYTLTVE